jgi:hypothetical protein
MDMTLKKMLLLVWLFAMMACSFLFGHFWSYAVYALQKVVAFGIVALLVFSKVLAGMVGIHLLA